MKPAANPQPESIAGPHAMTSPTILNVLHLPGLAGTEMMYLQYTYMLRDAGYNVVCLVPPGALVLRELQERGIPAIEDKAVHVSRGKFNPLQISHYRRLLRDRDVKLVLTHSGGLTRLFRRVCGKRCPLVTVNHNTNPKQSAAADYAIATNRHIWEQITELGMAPERVKLLFNSTEILHPAWPCRPYHKTPVIGSLGRMDGNKRVDTLLHALAILRDRGVAFSAVLGGDGPCREELETLSNTLGLEKHVQFYGWVHDKQDFFDKIDIFAFCSMCESFPLVMLEAMQYGHVVVSSDFEGVKDMVSDGETGQTFPRGNAEALADQLASLMADEERAMRMAKNAFERTRNHFSKEAIEHQLDDFIRTILS